MAKKALDFSSFNVLGGTSKENECSEVTISNTTKDKRFGAGISIPTIFFDAALEHFNKVIWAPMATLPQLEPYKDSVAQIAIIHAYVDMNVAEKIQSGVMPRVADINKDDTRVIIIDGPQHWNKWCAEHYAKPLEKNIGAAQFPVLNRPAVKYYASARHFLRKDICARQVVWAFINSETFHKLPQEHPLKIIFSSPYLGELMANPDLASDHLIQVDTGDAFNYHFHRKLNTGEGFEKPEFLKNFLDLNLAFSPFVRAALNFIIDIYTNFISYINGSNNNSRYASEAMQTLDMLGVFPIEDNLVMYSRPSLSIRTVDIGVAAHKRIELHNETGPAIKFVDGCEFFFYKGIEMPAVLYSNVDNGYAARVVNCIDKREPLPFSGVCYKPEQYIKTLRELAAKRMGNNFKDGLMAIDAIAQQAMKNE